MSGRSAECSFELGRNAAEGLQRKILTEHIISHAMYVVKREGYVREGDMVVFTAGDPATNMVKGKGAMTNMMHVIEAK